MQILGRLQHLVEVFDRLDEDDLNAVIETARMVYRLYGAMFRGVTARCTGGEAARELTDALV